MKNLPLFLLNFRIAGQAFADLHILSLDNPLDMAKPLEDNGYVQGLVLPQAKIIGRNGLAPAEPLDQFVLQTDVEPAGARITLTARPSLQLVIDPLAFMQISAEDI
ncbi:hypothetical protein D3C71_1747060 [compost metagenome]